MQANSLCFNPTQDTLDQIVQGALPILKALGLEMGGRSVPEARKLPVISPERLARKLHFTGIGPEIFWAT